MANEFAFTYDGTDTSDAAYGITVNQGLPFAGMLPPRIQKFAFGGRSGGAASCDTFDVGGVALRCVLIATSADNRQTQFDALKALIDPTQGPKFFRMPHHKALSAGLQREVEAIIDVPINETPVGNQSLTFDLHVYFLGPFQGIVDVTQQVAIDESPESFNVTAAGAVAGNAEAFPLWTLTNTDGATITTLTLVNTTRTETLVWADATGLAQNDELRIDAGYDKINHIEKSDDGGSTWTNAMQGLGAGNPFPTLTGAVQNACTISGFVAGTLDIAYRPRWL